MRKLFFILVCILTLSGIAQTTGNSNQAEFTLKAAIDYALTHNANYLNAQLDEKSTRYKKNEILGLGMPQIGASFDFKDFEKIPTSVLPNFVAPVVLGTLMQAGVLPYDPNAANPDNYPPIAAQFGVKYNATATISASQIVFSSDYIIGVQAAKKLSEMMQKNTLRTKAETVSAVSKAYYLCLVNKERIKLLDANLVRLKKLVDDTRALNQQGFVEKIDVDRLEVAYNNLSVEKEKTEKLIGLSDIVLKFQMGYKIADPIVLTDKLDESAIMQLTADTEQKINYESRPEYAALKTQVRLSEIDLKRNRLSYLPTVVAYGSIGASALRGNFDLLDGVSQKWYPTGLIGFGINLSIFDGFQKHYRIQQAKMSMLKAKNGINQLESAIEMDVRQSAISYNNALKSLELQKKNVELAREIMTVAEKKNQQGVGSNLEILNAETTLREAETNYFNAVYDVLVSTIEFQRATGTLVK